MKKRQIKISVDILMTILLLFLMGYQFWGDAAHEWVGFFLFILFILHHLLNIQWYKNLCRGRYTPLRIFQLIIDILLFFVMIGLMISSILLSSHVLPFLKIQGMTSFARILHMATAYWSYVLMALHLGLHWGILVALVRKNMVFPLRLKPRITLLIAVVIALMGLGVFIQRDLLTYMLVQTEFVFLDFNESKIRFYLDYLALMGLFIFIAYYISKWLRSLKVNK